MHAEADYVYHGGDKAGLIAYAAEKHPKLKEVFEGMDYDRENIVK